MCAVARTVCRVARHRKFACDCHIYWTECPTMSTISMSPPDARSDSSESDHRPSLWARLGRFSFRRRRYVLGAWIATLVAVFALVGSIGASSDSSVRDPRLGVQERLRHADDLLRRARQRPSGSIVFRADQGVDDPDVEAAMTAAVRRGRARSRGVTITSPYSMEGQVRGQVATEGELAAAWSRTPRSTSPRTVTETQSGEIGAQIGD